MSRGSRYRKWIARVSILRRNLAVETITLENIRARDSGEAHFLAASTSKDYVDAHASYDGFRIQWCIEEASVHQTTGVEFNRSIPVESEPSPVNPPPDTLYEGRPVKFSAVKHFPVDLDEVVWAPTGAYQAPRSDDSEQAWWDAWAD